MVVLKEYLKPFVIEEYDVPDPEPGAILLKITQAGICGSDLHVWRGDLTANPLPPNGWVMGHEGTGVVAKLGEGVTTDSSGRPIHEGDRLMYTCIVPCNRCYHCLRGEHNWCPNRPTLWEAGAYPYFTGTYADYYYIGPKQPVFSVPSELPNEVLGFVNCATVTVTEGLLRAGRQGRGLRRHTRGGRPWTQRNCHGQGHGGAQGDSPGSAGESVAPGRRVRGRSHDQHRGVEHPGSPTGARVATYGGTWCKHRDGVGGPG